MRSNTPQIIAALDIGTTKITCIVARKTSNGKLDILAMSKTNSTGVMRGVITNIDKTVEAIKTVVADASRKSGIPIYNLYVGIAGQHIKSAIHKAYIMRSHDQEEINKGDIARLIDDVYKAAYALDNQIIHVLPQEFNVDAEKGIKDPIGMSGVRLEGNFHVITGQKSAIQNIHRCVQRAGYEVVEIMLEPIASAAAVLCAEEIEAGVALVDIGGGTTDLTLFLDGILRHSAVIPLGGNIITEDIKEGCMVMPEQAEKLKVKFGSALVEKGQENKFVTINGLRGRGPKEISVRNLSQIIQARMEEILEYVYNEIASAGFERKLIGGIVITGGGAQLTQLVHLAQMITGLDIRIGYADEHLNKHNPIELRNPIYATGIGLAISALATEQPVSTQKIEEPTAQPQPNNETSAQPTQVINTEASNNQAHQNTIEEFEEEAPLALNTNEQATDNWLSRFLKVSRNWLEGGDKLDDFKNVRN